MLKSTDRHNKKHGIPFTLLKDPNDVAYNVAHKVQCQY